MLTRSLLSLVFVASAFAAPTVSTLSPANGSSVSSFSSLSVTFSEAVTGVGSNDLLVNGEAPVSVTGSGAGPYVFTFTQPGAGTVSVSWEADHGIAGLGTGAFVAPSAYAFSLSDTVAPTLVQTTPLAGATMGVLTQVQVSFSELVSGVDAADLLVNGTPATAVTGAGVGPYLFTITQPAAGALAFTWAGGHGIVDGVGNPFAGAGWSVTVGATGTVVINEFLAQNGLGLADENAEQNDWIELLNTGASAVNVAGWALTNDVDEQDKWVLPSRTIASGGTLLVFASGKDRKPGSGNLHTNFKLNENGGTLQLYTPDSPRVLTSPSFAPFPAQRTDYSYGRGTAGALVYFTPSTPNAPNAAGTLTTIAANPTASVTRGFFKDPFTVVLSCATPSASIRYTLDGSVPTAASTLYATPLSVSTTTLLRAVAFATNFVPSETITHSYIYLDAVTAQTSPPYSGANLVPTVGGVALPTSWGTNATFTAAAVPLAGYVAGQIPADYGMDDKVWNDPNKYDDTGAINAAGKTNLERIKTCLRTLPVMSVVMKTDDMFGPASTGIYPSASESVKPDLTKACSLEMLLPNGSTAFHVNCGIDLHGNASRAPYKNPKHGFTLKFKGDYGPGKLDYQMFPDSPVQSFDKLVLRADFNSSWRHQDGSVQRPKGTRIRDAWSKDTFRAMGRAASHHRYVNLFINGIYWGTYDPSEDEAEDFAAAYFGGDKADYDVIDQGVLKNGTMTAYYAMKATLGWTGATYTTVPTAGVLATAFTNAEYETLKGQLDMPWFIDYMIHHYYVGHEDWGTTADYNKNWYFVKSSKPGSKFRLLPWDQENLLWSETVNRVTGALYPPVAAQNRLRTNAQFALDFADQVHKHMISPDGALLPAANIARHSKWTAIVNADAQAAESARWGDYRMMVHQYTSAPYNIVYTWNGKWYSGGATQTTTTHWLSELTRLNGTYFPLRTANVVGQFRATPTAPALVLYPSVNAPEIRNNVTDVAIASQRVAAGFVVKFANVASLPSGTSNATTFYYTTNGTDPRVYYASTVATGAVSASPGATYTVNATTTLKVRAFNGSIWSALNEQTFTVGNDSLIPTVRITEIMYNPPGNTNDDAKEFIELRNIGTQPVDMSGWYFGGVDCVIPLGTVLGAGDHFVLANNDSPTVFAATYPGVAVGAFFGGNLDNGGERVSLHDAGGRVIVSVDYRDARPWPVAADGNGPSLEIINADGDPDDAANWKASAASNGTPGATNSALAAGMEFSEFLVKNGGAYTFSGANPGFIELQNTSGSAITLNFAYLHVDGAPITAFPNGTIVAPGAFLLAHFHDTTLPGVTGTPRLPADHGLIELRVNGITAASVRYGPQAANYSFGKVSGNWTLTTPTPDAANIAATSAAQSNLRLNEWLANPRPGLADWLELYNTHATQPVVLGGFYASTDAQLFQYKCLAAVAPLGWARLYCNEGTNRADALDFNLPGAGTTLTIRDSGGTQADSLTYTAQTQSVSTGRLPDGTATIAALIPSPGIANHIAITGTAQLNEILVTNYDGDNAPWGRRPAWLELRNPTDSSIALGGWRLRLGRYADDWTSAWTFPSGTSISAGGHLAIWCDPVNALPSTVSSPNLNSGLYVGIIGDGTRILDLLNPAGQLVDTVTYGQQIADKTIGRTSGGTWALLATPTRSATNAAAAALGPVSAIRINEWTTSSVEFFNTSALPVALGGLYLSDDPSEVGRRKFAFPPLSYVAGSGFATSSSLDLGFEIDFGGEYLRLAQNDDTQLDAQSFGTVGGYLYALGRLPDGTGAVAPLWQTQNMANAAQGTAPVISYLSSPTVGIAGSTIPIGAMALNATTYQWNFNGAPIPSGASGAYSAATTLTYYITAASTMNDGNYTVTFTGPGGSVTSAAVTVTVLHTFDTWTASHGIPGAATDGDSDGDGIKNLAEFLANTNPTVAATAAERTANQVISTLELTSGVPTMQTLEFRLNRRASFTLNKAVSRM